MGALTLKSFPFELRGWDIEKFESIDPTDGFGSNTRVYINKDQVIQIEPDYDVQTFNTWLTDKGRQFFDGIFGTWSLTKKSISVDKNNSITDILAVLIKNIYMLEHCNKQRSNKKFFTIVFENLSIEVVSLLLMFSKNYSFIKLKRAENNNNKNDLESNFQLNSEINRINLMNSDLCLLVSTNIRYEGYYLNLNLRQRFLKGNFKCFILGSCVDLTFPTKFIGSNIKIFKDILEGNHSICQDLKIAKNPLLILPNDLIKRDDVKNIIEIFKQSTKFNIAWNNYNVLNPTLSETGTNIINKFNPVNLTDLTNFGSMYFINVNLNLITNFKKLIELKLLNYNNKKYFTRNSIVLDQNFNYNNQNIHFKLNNNNNDKNCFYLTNTMFYENEETFVNTEGLVKRTTKLIFRKKSKSNWQLIRKFFKTFKTNLVFLDNKMNHLLFFNSNSNTNFKNYMYFHFLATQSLTNLNFYLNIKNNPFLLKDTYKFKISSTKIKNTKLKYWLDDFFSGGKDEYSNNSLILTNCSKITRTESSNFF
jgi:hypothetical protein